MTPPTNTTDAQHTNPEPITRTFKAIQLIVDKKSDTACIEAEPLYIGTKNGQCDICKATRKTYLLKFGFALCEDCLNICTMILEQFKLDEENPPAKPHKIVPKPKLN